MKQAVAGSPALLRATAIRCRLIVDPRTWGTRRVSSVRTILGVTEGTSKSAIPRGTGRGATANLPHVRSGFYLER